MPGPVFPAILILSACAGPTAAGAGRPPGHAEPTPAHAGPGAAASRAVVPDPAAGEPVTLAQVLAWAETHAPPVRIAEARMEHADAVMEEARLGVPSDPSLQVAIGPRMAPGGTDYDVQSWLTQRVEVAGERRLRIVAADALGHRLRAARSVTRWEVHQRVHHAFHEALAAREHVEAAERLGGFEDRMLEIAEARVRAGDASPLQVRLAEGERARARQHLLMARQRYDAARLTLAEAAGWPPEHPPAPAGELDPPRDAPPLDRLLALAERHQPVLHAREAALEEAEARVRLADREASPKPTLGVGYQREGSPTRDPEHSVLGQIGTTLPVARRNRGPRARARATRAEARAERDAYFQELRVRIARAARAVESASERVRVYGTELLPAFEESLRMLERAHELGEVDVLQVGTAVERFLRAQEDALQAYEDYHEAAAALEAAVGTDLWGGERHGETEDAP
ncbi:MAG: TolC family protein [Myxococcota bacterium]